MTSERGQRIVRVDWTSNADGECDIYFNGLDLPRLSGLLDRVTTAPSVVNPPTANYDVYLYDRNGYDLLGGLLLNRSASAAELVFIYATYQTSHYSDVPTETAWRLSIRNAGINYGGSILLHLLPMESIANG